MTARLRAADASFPQAFTRLLCGREEQVSNVASVVKTIIDKVKKEGDAALLAYTTQFDRFEATEHSIIVPHEAIEAAAKRCPLELLEALSLAAARIMDYSKRQLPQDMHYTDATGTVLGHRWTPIESVGLYVPGGLAAYPSSVLMNAIPAKAAGVERLVMVVPTPDGKLPDAILAAAHVAGIDTIYKIGGAQAVAALAYGTQTIAPVDKIVGPGNAYVAEAKRQVFGTVGIDMIAGPSEILVIADSQNDPRWIAADLLSQAEHDPLAQSILITDDENFAARVEQEVKNILATLPRRDIAGASWEKHGAVIVVDSIEQACELANRIAPEHLELAVEKPDALLPLIRHAGAIFLGRHTPEAVGDYIAGPSHVLPTSRTARFSSGLSVFDFLKRTSLVGCTASSLATINKHVVCMAQTEGLDAHALSASVRSES